MSQNATPGRTVGRRRPGRGGPDRASGGRVLGHGRGPDRAPAARDHAPDRVPAYALLGWLASVVLAPLGEPAFRMNLLSAILLAVGRPDRRSSPASSASALHRARPRGSPSRPPIVWSIGTHAHAHALHLACRRAPAPLGGSCDWERPRTARRPGGADRAHRGRGRVRRSSLANHGPDAAAAPGGRPVRARGRARILRRRRSSRRRSRPSGSRRCSTSSSRSAPGRSAPPLVYGHPETWAGFWDVVLARQFQGSVDPSATSTASWRRRPTSRSPSSGRSCPRPVGLPRGGRPPPAVRAAFRRRSCTTACSPPRTRTPPSSATTSGLLFFAWTWLAILGGAVVARASNARFAPAPAAPLDARPGHGRGALALAVALAAPDRRPRCRALAGPSTNPADRRVHDWLDDVLDGPRTRRRGRLVVVLLDPAVVRPARRAPPARTSGSSTTGRASTRTWAVQDVIEANLDTRPGLPHPGRSGRDLRAAARYVMTQLAVARQPALPGRRPPGGYA